MAGVLAFALAAAMLPGTQVPDAELAQMRGGFSLPNGIEIALTVRSDTSVNGALLLRSVFTAISGNPTLQVFAPASGQAVPAAPPAEAQGADGAASVAAAGNVAAIGSAEGSNALSVQFDRQNGAVILPGTFSVVPAINVTTGATAAAGVADEGLSVVPVVAGGGAIETAGGQVSIAALPDGARIRLEGAGIDVSHLVGAAFGSVIANTSSDRVIETTTTVGLDLGNTSPDVLGSTMFQVENLAVEAVRLGIR